MAPLIQRPPIRSTPPSSDVVARGDEEEMLITDNRGSIRPSDAVERKLQRMLESGRARG